MRPAEISALEDRKLVFQDDGGMNLLSLESNDELAQHLVRAGAKVVPEAKIIWQGFSTGHATESRPTHPRDAFLAQSSRPRLGRSRRQASRVRQWRDLGQT